MQTKGETNSTDIADWIQVEHFFLNQKYFKNANILLSDTHAGRFASVSSF